MQVFKDVAQCSPEWFALKYGKVGGSASKGLFVQSDTLMLEILSELTEPFILQDDGYVSKDMERGNLLEPIGIQRIGEFAKVKFERYGWLLSDEIDIIGISPDGITDDLTISCEVKCPAAKRHIETMVSKEIPSDNRHQCLHYFTVNEKLQKHYFGSFRPESDYPLFIKELTRESNMDLGTKAKPLIKSVGEWVDIAKFNAKKLKTDLQAALTNLDRI